VSKYPSNDIVLAINKTLEHHFFATPESRICPTCHKGTLMIKLGKFGAFAACSSYPECGYTRNLDGNQMQDTPQQSEKVEDQLITQDPNTGMDILLRKGPYGFYLQLGNDVKGSKIKPKRTSVPSFINPSEIDTATAIGLINLPREIGIHPDTDKMISASIGKFGPYLLHDGKYTTIPSDENILTIGINRAVALIADKKKVGSTGPQRVIGKHPESGLDIPIYSGRFGPYIKYQKYNVTIPKKFSPDTLTLEQAVTLIAEYIERKG
jgi:DNA topoisomerase-1